MIEFRPCPSYPGYSCSYNGDVRREPVDWITCTGKPKTRDAKIINHVGRDKAYVTLAGQFVRWEVLRVDAWGEHVASSSGGFDPWNPFAGPRPVSDYPGGRVITVDEWRAEVAAARAAAGEAEPG